MTHETKQIAPRIEGVSHQTLPIGDLAVAEDFYVGLLGAELVRRFDRETFLRLRPERAGEADADNSPLHLAVRFGDGPEYHLFVQKTGLPLAPAPHPHTALAIDDDDLDRFALRLRERGVPCDGPRRLGPPGQASLYFLDPWGNRLELVCTGYEGRVSHGPPDFAKLGYAYRPSA